jgi:hypothetical protein
MATTTKSTATKSTATKGTAAAGTDDVDAAPVRRPRLGEDVLVAVHPDKQDGRDDVAPATVTRVVQDDDGQLRVNLRVHFDGPHPTGHLSDVPWFADRAAFEQAEEAAFELLPGHRRKGNRFEPGENHITQAPWRVEDVRHWQTGAWPLDAGGE